MELSGNITLPFYGEYPDFLIYSPPIGRRIIINSSPIRGSTG
jgi:hypothetical protein